MAPAPPPRLTLAWIELGQHCLTLVAKLVSICLMSLMLFYSKWRPSNLRVKGLSPCFQLYMLYHSCASTMGLPYVVYLLFWGLPNLFAGIDVSPYNPYTIYWTGVFEINYTSIAPALATFLALERCMILRGSTIGHIKCERNAFRLACLVVTLLWIGSWISISSELPLQMDKVSDCMVMSCETRRTMNLPQLSIKMVFSTLNLVFSAYFLWLIHKQPFAANLKNQIVKWAMISEFLFITWTAYSNIAFNLLTGASMSLYVGEFGFTFAPVDAFVCSIAYWLILVKTGAEVANTKQQLQAPTIVKQKPRYSINLNAISPQVNGNGN